MYNLPPSRASQIDLLASNVWELASQTRPPLDVKAVLRSRGVAIVPSRMDNVEAVLDLRDSVPCLHLDSRMYSASGTSLAKRTTFTYGHELGHLMLHGTHDILFRESHRDRKNAALNGDVEYCLRENEADAFAASLLMPSERFRKDIQNLSKIGKDWRASLSNVYGVSYSSLDRRLAFLRDGLCITGEAFADSGRIDWVFPSRQLEQAKPDIAKVVWGANDIVPSFHTYRLPSNILSGINPSNPTSRAHLQLYLRDIFFPVRYSDLCELSMWPRAHQRLFFDIVIPQ